MDKLYQELEKRAHQIDKNYMFPNQMKRIVGEAVIAVLDTVPVVSSRDINDALDRLVEDSIVAVEELRGRAFATPSYNRYLREISYDTLGEVVEGFAQERNPDGDNTIHYPDGIVWETTVYYADEKKMREHISGKLKETGVIFTLGPV